MARKINCGVRRSANHIASGNASQKKRKKLLWMLSVKPLRTINYSYQCVCFLVLLSLESSDWCSIFLMAILTTPLRVPLCKWCESKTTRHIRTPPNSVLRGTSQSSWKGPTRDGDPLPKLSGRLCMRPGYTIRKGDLMASQKNLISILSSTIEWSHFSAVDYPMSWLTVLD